MAVAETTNYKLKKPDRTEIVRVGDINFNSDAIDKGLENRSRFGSTTPIFDVNNDHKGDRYYDTTLKKEYYCTGSMWIKMESGKEYSAGDGITIDATNEISVNNTIARKTDLDSKVNVSTDKVIKDIAKTIAADKITLRSNRRSLELTTTTDSIDLEIPAADVTNNKAGLYTKVHSDATAGLVDAEKARAIAAENALESDLTNEISRSTTKDNALESALNTEAATRLANDNTLQNNINTEVTRATNAEDALGTRLDTIEAGYIVKVETVDSTTITSRDGKIKFTASPSSGSKDVVIYSGLTLNGNGISVNETATIRDISLASDNIFPSEKATRGELNKKEDLTNKKQSVSTQSEYSSPDYYPSLAFVTRHIIRKGTYNDSTDLQGDIVDDLSGGGTDGRKNRALSAYQGKILADMIADISTIGRYLSSWNCETGMPGSEPSVDPYPYKSGDYYIVSKGGAAGSALIPDGSEYHRGVPSTRTSPDEVDINDVYRYDGTNWIHSSEARDVAFGNIQGDPRDNAKLNYEFNLKSSGIILSDGSATYSPDSTKGYYVQLGVGNVVNKLVKLGGVIGTNEGIKWDGIRFVSAKFEYDLNKVTAFQYTPDNIHYPSEKLVKDSLDKKLNLTGGTLTGDVVVESGAKITLLQTTFGDTDAVTKKFVSDNYLKLSGGTLTGELAMSDYHITGLGDPDADTDAVNRRYLEANTFASSDTPALSNLTGVNGATGYVLTPEYKKLNSTHDVVPSTPLTIPVVTDSVNGLMLKDDKSKIDRMAYITDADINTIIGGW